VPWEFKNITLCLHLPGVFLQPDEFFEDKPQWANIVWIQWANGLYSLSGARILIFNI
jgi:hypothetical protein